MDEPKGTRLWRLLPQCRYHHWLPLFVERCLFRALERVDKTLWAFLKTKMLLWALGRLREQVRASSQLRPQIGQHDRLSPLLGWRPRSVLHWLKNFR